jgi:hypothetical protein
VAVLKKTGNFLRGFSSNFVVEHAKRSAAAGLCFRIVTISSAVCNTNCPPFLNASFQTHIFPELKTGDFYTAELPNLQKGRTTAESNVECGLFQ